MMPARSSSVLNSIQSLRYACGTHVHTNTQQRMHAHAHSNTAAHAHTRACRVIRAAYQLRLSTPEPLRPATAEWAPLPKTGTYTDFTQYPAAGVELFAQVGRVEKKRGGSGDGNVMGGGAAACSRGEVGEACYEGGKRCRLGRLVWCWHEGEWNCCSCRQSSPQGGLVLSRCAHAGAQEGGRGGGGPRPQAPHRGRLGYQIQGHGVAGAHKSYRAEAAAVQDYAPPGY